MRKSMIFSSEKKNIYKGGNTKKHKFMFLYVNIYVSEH